MHEAHATFAHPPRNVHALGIETGMKVADFGSGGGAYALLISQRLADSGHIYAIDVQRDLLRRIHNEAKRKGVRNLSIIWGDLERPGGSKLADGSLDFVLISNLLFQIERKEAVVTEAARILRNGGRLAIIEWSDSFNGMGPVQEDVVTKEKALALAREAEFDFIREFVAGAHHYGLLFRKPA